MNYYFHPQARIEHLEHVAYYESRQPGLGARYLAAFNKAMVRVCAAPHRYKIAFPPNILRYRIAGFPYNILYQQADSEIEVLAVAPHRRRPDYWFDRG
ncbi:MAG: type II toxin-antitoxin system RelE/ParE family toxin [Methylococcales bacterium]